VRHISSVYRDRTPGNSHHAEYVQRCSDLETALNDYEPGLRKMDGLLSQMIGELKYFDTDTRYAKLTPMATVLQKVVRKDLESADF